MSTEALDLFANNVFPPVVFIFGLTGDIMGLIVLTRENLSKMSMINAYRLLLASDLFYFLTQTVIINIMFSYPSIDPTARSAWFCKVFNYSNYALFAPSPAIIIYFSVERLVASKFPAKRFLLKKDKVFFIYVGIVSLISLIYFSPILFYYDLIETETIVDNATNATEISVICNNASTFGTDLVFWLFLIAGTVIPYSLLILCTILLILTIFQSRMRMKTDASKSKFKKDLKFAITLITLNLIFIILTLPVSLTAQGSVTTTFAIDMYLMDFTLFAASYGVNFYLLIATNSKIRDEFFIFIRIKKEGNQSK